MSAHTTQSSYREAVLESLFVGELLRTLWLRGVHAEVLRPSVDDAGYDIVVDANGVLRHIQLKASFSGAATDRQKVHQHLRLKPSGCVVWLRFEESTLRFTEYLWFGGLPGEPLPDLSGFPAATHTKPNSAGVKTPRPRLRVVPGREFESVPTITHLGHKLFGRS